MSDPTIGIVLLAELAQELIDNIYSAWREGAADCHTTGEDEHWLETDARSESANAKRRLDDLRKELGL